MRRDLRGFTLIEMLVTLTLIAILASVVVPLAQVSMQRNQEQELKLALREIRTALDSYKQAADDGRIFKSADDTGYPAQLALLVEGVPELKDPRGRKLFFLRRIPRDPMNQDESLTADATWGKRAYRSEANAPAAGEDVYDVYSLSTKTGMNGITYKEW